MKDCKRCLIASALLVSLGWMASAHAQITPSQDAYTNSATPTTNFGTAVTLGVVNTASSIQNTYLQFDLSSIPSGYSGANVAKATLKLYVNTVPTAGSFNVDFVSGGWTEKTITANLSPALGTAIASSVPLTSANVHDFVLIDVTTAVQDWLNGSQPNDGLALVANSPLSATFDSKENTTQSHPAELDIVYSGVAGVTTASGSGLIGGGTSGTLTLSLTNVCATNQVLKWNSSAWACASGGTGTVTSVGSGTGLTGGPITGSGTLSINPAVVPLLTSANTFTAAQTVNAGVSANSFDIGGALVLYGSNNNANVFLGFGNAGNPIAGTFNTAVGSDNMYGLTTGGSNSAFGDAALVGVGAGSNNTAVGASALSFTSTSNNTAVGIDAGTINSAGTYNTYIGSYAGVNSGPLTSYSYSSAVGANSSVGASNAMALGAPGAVSNGLGQVNVGIGTSTPAYRLDVSYGDAIVRGAGNFNPQANLYVGDGAHEIQAVSGGGIGLSAYGATNALWVNDNFSGGNGCQFGYVGIWTTCATHLLTLNQGSGAAIGDGWQTYSSRRWKTNIQTLDGALAKIERMRGVSYDLRENGKHEIGVIAEEVGAVVPEIVSWEKNGTDARGVDYARLTALLIEAAKEQQKLIRHQQRQIRLQQAQLTRLSSQVKTIEAALKNGGSALEPRTTSLATSRSLSHGQMRCRCD